jgi:hypothetical protein
VAGRERGPFGIVLDAARIGRLADPDAGADHRWVAASPSARPLDGFEIEIEVDVVDVISGLIGYMHVLGGI